MFPADRICRNIGGTTGAGPTTRPAAHLGRPKLPGSNYKPVLQVLVTLSHRACALAARYEKSVPVPVRHVKRRAPGGGIPHRMNAALARWRMSWRDTASHARITGQKWAMHHFDTVVTGVTIDDS
ncbi:hypothetical protein GCM10009539_11020 [Cryptosporangium japonicum]|uniref:Transposase n=1 Tax=Cryptosporangium japonicum TaxID=80872 RepID=A0ABP3DC38_9ACTN